MKRIDARGRSCPMPIVELARAARQCAPGEQIEILATGKVLYDSLQANTYIACLTRAVRDICLEFGQYAQCGRHR